jgi:DNA-binding NtrC family response regulator
MPGMDGLELATKIAALGPAIRIVYMSAGMTQEEWCESQDVQSGSFFLQEPFRMDDLKKLISTILAEPSRASRNKPEQLSSKAHGKRQMRMDRVQEHFRGNHGWSLILSDPLLRICPQTP